MVHAETRKFNDMAQVLAIFLFSMTIYPHGTGFELSLESFWMLLSCKIQWFLKHVKLRYFVT